jgi:hypothetical protein
VPAHGTKDAWKMATRPGVFGPSCGVYPRRQAWAAAIDRSRTLPTTAHDLDISA